MNPKAIDKMTLVTLQGLFWFTVMPFGLCNAPAMLERLMELVLSDHNQKTCLIYRDNMLSSMGAINLYDVTSIIQA